MAVATSPPLSAPGRASRIRRDRRFLALLALSVAIGVASLVTLLVDTLLDGVPRLSWAFLNEFPSRFAERAGIKPALYGSLWLIAVCTLFTVPVGMGAAIYLEEYARKGPLQRLIEVNVSNLAGVPSVIYGLLGLGVFVRFFAMGHSVLAGGLTLGLLVLPVVVTAGRESIRAVPPSIKEAALALGATRWQAVSRQVVPAALPGFMTGIILAISRALGETAPLIALGAATSISFVPASVRDEFTALPIQIYNWVQRPQAAFLETAAAGIVVLLVVLLTMNGVAIYIRNRFQRKW